MSVCIMFLQPAHTNPCKGYSCNAKLLVDPASARWICKKQAKTSTFGARKSDCEEQRV